jgi:hypothetical protein
VTERSVIAFVSDLMDQSRLRAALGDVEFAHDPGRAIGAQVVVVDLSRFRQHLPAIRAATSGRVVAYGAHVDRALLDEARAVGADVVMPRSRFFSDPAASVADPSGNPR